MYKIKINNESETILLGKILGSFLNNTIIIGLDGDLGSGKTCFSKGIALSLGITQTVKSPTFSLVNYYNGNSKLYHLDVYRLCDPSEIFLLGLDDFINENSIILIEWASIVKDFLPNNSNYIYIKKIDNNKRIFTFDFSKEHEYIISNTIKKFNKEVIHNDFNT